MKNILLVEDELVISRVLKAYLQKAGYQVWQAVDGLEATQLFDEKKPDLVLLDVMLPERNGWEILQYIREKSACPVIMITALGQTDQKLMGLNEGADDYITKPFDYDVVMAKIRSQLRRAYGLYAPQEGERTVEVAGLKLFLERMELSIHDTKVELSKKEALLLEALMNQYPRVVSRERLLEKLWDEQFVDENTLNVYITRVRGKLKDMGLEGAVETVRGSGYRLRAVWEDGQ